MGRRGFTLVEMLVCLAIIGTLSAVVIARFTTFDSSILLKNAALDVAATLRQAQILSVSVRGGSVGGFDNAYGVSFVPNGQDYTLYRFYDPVGSYPQNNGFANQVIDPILFNVSLKISDICIKTNSSPDPYCYSGGYGITQLDISFRRPEFKALFYVDGSSLTGITNPGNDSDGNIESVSIHLESLREPGNEYTVDVGLLGHISVQKAP